MLRPMGARVCCMARPTFRLQGPTSLDSAGITTAIYPPLFPLRITNDRWWEGYRYIDPNGRPYLLYRMRQPPVSNRAIDSLDVHPDPIRVFLHGEVIASFRRHQPSRASRYSPSTSHSSIQNPR
jgi:hypothetical protein